jgi:hypothetical protein
VALGFALLLGAGSRADDKPAGGTSAQSTPGAKTSDKTETLPRDPLKPKDGLNRASDDLASCYQRERRNYLRRLAVCAELKEIASRTNDLELERKIEQLEERAFAVYNLRTGNPQPPASFDPDDDKTDDRHADFMGAPLPGREAASANNSRLGREDNR